MSRLSFALQGLPFIRAIGGQNPDGPQQSRPGTSASESRKSRVRAASSRNRRAERRAEAERRALMSAARNATGG